MKLDRGARIARTTVGEIYAAVQLDDGSAGVAYRFPEGNECPRGAGASTNKRDSERADPWAGRESGELIRLLGGPDLVQSALALATVNALGAGSLAAAPLPGSETQLSGDVLDHLELRDGDRVCMVGCFLPLLERLTARNIQVLAVDERPKAGALPAEQVETLLSSSQVALITATSLVNATLGRLLDLAGSCRAVVLLGPSTPMLPQAFAATPIKLLSGIRITAAEHLIEIVAAGGGFRDFRPHVRKVNLRI
jgi:uncharacterized protein (DUF4213/DUF364 family)